MLNAPVYIVVQPAYGVVLNSQKAVRQHYDANKDFQILTLGKDYLRYITKTDVNIALTQLNRRYVLECRYGKNNAKTMLLT